MWTPVAHKIFTANTSCFGFQCPCGIDPMKSQSLTQAACKYWGVLCRGSLSPTLSLLSSASSPQENHHLKIVACRILLFLIISDFFFRANHTAEKKKKSLQEAQNGYEVWVLIPKNDIHNSLFHQAQTCSTFQGGAISYLKMTWRLLFSMMNSFPCGLHFCHLPCLWFQRKGELCKRQRLRTSGPGAWYAIGMNREGHRG